MYYILLYCASLMGSLLKYIHSYMPKVDAIVLNCRTSSLSTDKILMSPITIIEVDIFHILYIFGIFLTFLAQYLYKIYKF